MIFESKPRALAILGETKVLSDVDSEEGGMKFPISSQREEATECFPCCLAHTLVAQHPMKMLRLVHSRLRNPPWQPRNSHSWVSRCTNSNRDFGIRIEEFEFLDLVDIGAASKIFRGIWFHSLSHSHHSVTGTVHPDSTRQMIDSEMSTWSLTPPASLTRLLICHNISRRVMVTVTGTMQTREVSPYSDWT